MDIIKCPLNYQGGKTKLLPQILPLFPSKINTFVDLFGGGFNVGANVKANNYVYNDLNLKVARLIYCMYSYNPNFIIREINKRIKKNKLSKKSDKSYYKFRNMYNKNNHSSTLDLFTLIMFSFNNDIRFNSNGEFNKASGKGRSYFNPTIQNNIYKFCDRISSFDIKFCSKHFERVDIPSKSFVYCDPPYLITDSDNYNSYWNEKEEKKLLNYLDALNKKGIKFALSNVLRCKGKTNKILKKWAKNYNVFHLNFNYNNCSFVRKNRDKITDEVLITNYKPNITEYKGLWK